MGRRRKLQNLGETRWAAKSDTLFTFKASFPVVIGALSYHGEDGAECRAYGASISRLDFSIIHQHHCIGGVWTCSTNPKTVQWLPPTAESSPCTGNSRGRYLGEDIAWWERQRQCLLGLVWRGSRTGNKCLYVLPSKLRRAGRQMQWNNVAADSPFHYWQFALYNVLSMILWTNWKTNSLSQKPTFAAQLLIPTNLHKMAADDQLITKHAYEPYINGDAFDMECKRWKARWSGEQNPTSTLTTILDALNAELYPNISFILTVH